MGKVSAEWKPFPSFIYIRVIKLSCSACEMWIEGYNKRNCPFCYTCRTHGKCYFPLAIARFDDSHLSLYMVHQITNTFYDHSPAKDKIRRLSDSSNIAIDHLGTSRKPRTEDLASACLARLQLEDLFLISLTIYLI